jgi:polysaccharide biosynthesis acetyltransferase WcbI-like protein
MQTPPAEAAAAARPVLTSLIKARTGRHIGSGAIEVRGHERPEIFLYGPYWALGGGAHRLEFTCRAIRVPDPADVFLSVEVLADNRIFLAVADYALADLADGCGALTFSVPAAMAIGSGSSTFEFRFLHYGRASFVLSAAVLRPVGEAPAEEQLHRHLRWQLAQRARAGLLPRLRRYGSRERMRPMRAVRFAPVLKLPAASYELSLEVSTWARRKDALAVAVLVGGQPVARGLVEPTGTRRLAGRLRFEVDEAHSFAHGAADPLELEIEAAPGLRIGSLTLDMLPPAPVATTESSPPAPEPSGRAALNVVVVGNCQAELLTEGLRHLAVPRPLGVRYHFVGLQDRFLARGRADLQACDAVLIQDISDYSAYPLRDEIPSHVETHRFPMLRHSTPWPFDSHNGLRDRDAEAREAVDPMFPNLDGVLGRLRREIPDPVKRFEAYRSLELDWLPDIERLARFEERRLAAMDRSYGCELGSFILENFRRRPLFHSIGHPSAELFSRLLLHLCERMKLRHARVSRAAMAQLRNIEVPVHPLVGARLGIRWATERRLYTFRNQSITWSDYTRLYIAHFG